MAAAARGNPTDIHSWGNVGYDWRPAASARRTTTRSGAGRPAQFDDLAGHPGSPSADRRTGTVPSGHRRGGRLANSGWASSKHAAQPAGRATRPAGVSRSPPSRPAKAISAPTVTIARRRRTVVPVPVGDGGGDQQAREHGQYGEKSLSTRPSSAAGQSLCPRVRHHRHPHPFRERRTARALVNVSAVNGTTPRWPARARRSKTSCSYGRRSAAVLPSDAAWCASVVAACRNSR